MTKLANYQKNSFTLIELLLSLAILAVLTTYILYSKKDFSKEYKLLNKLENSFSQSSYEDFTKTSKTITIIKDGTREDLLVNKIEYEDENIKVFKYEL
jgi:prepilin-type N-terminal cleavage/methylation domain-containing protein